MITEILKCPVCNGRGIVPGGFYESIGDTWISNGATDSCRSCQGKGTIHVRTLQTMEELKQTIREVANYESTFMKLVAADKKNSEK